MHQIIVNTQVSYPIYIGQTLWSTQEFIERFQKHGTNIVIITDETVDALYADAIESALLKIQGVNLRRITVKPGEQHKTRETKQVIEDELLALGYGRDTCLIAVGGGVILDLAGFVAATYCRGIPVIYYPTTLLAMVDAAIGGKTGVNTPHGKNLIGAFKQPAAVFMDINTLDTLPDQEYNNAFSEVIKYALIDDAALFNLLSQEAVKAKTRDKQFLQAIIAQCCQIKKKIVEQDEHEAGLRELLNFGHTIGHALEKTTHYAMPHGQAVAIGMLVESYISHLMGFLPESALQTIEQLIKQCPISLTIPTEKLNQEIIKNALLYDKKTRNQSPRFVLLDDIGKPRIEADNYANKVAESKVEQGIVYMLKNYGKAADQ